MRRFSWQHGHIQDLQQRRRTRLRSVKSWRCFAWPWDMRKFIDDRVASISNLMREINEASWQADTTGDSGHQITADEIARQAV